MRPSPKRPPARVDWKSERDRLDLAAVAARLLGPAPGRRGEGGRKLWWRCPFHEDRNPSFCVDPGNAWWKCYGCGESGDAASLVMRVEGKSFPEAVSDLTGGRTSPSKRSLAGPAIPPAPKPPPRPSGLSEADALALVNEAADRIWTPQGSDALSYLTGPRVLSAGTIRAARLGFTPGVSIPTRDGCRSYQALGWVTPWFLGADLALVKIRQPDGRQPKYMEAFRHPSRVVCYPGPETIRPGRPLVVVEGEYDALSLGEALGDLAAVVTLGSASARPDASSQGPMMSAPRWFVATDADPAGDRAAEGWPLRARRVRPPGTFKDWTDARRGGVDLRRWWGEVISGIDHPELFPWQDLAAWRWGPGTGDPQPGIVIN